MGLISIGLFDDKIIKNLVYILNFGILNQGSCKKRHKREQ